MLNKGDHMGRFDYILSTKNMHFLYLPGMYSVTIEEKLLLKAPCRMSLLLTELIVSSNLT